LNYLNEIDVLIKIALNEDVRNGDITTIATINENVKANGVISAKDDGVIAGINVAEKVFQMYDKSLEMKKNYKDGDTVKKGDIIATVYGKASSILITERTALNFMQRMSGIATSARKMAELIKHTKAKIIDTRKTVPCLRIIDKLAVSISGCENHRMGLYDMFLIKDNHIVASGSITEAVKKCREYQNKIKKNYKIEVETKTIDEVKEAIECKADIVMLDNFDIEKMKQAVKYIDGVCKIEASGGLNIDTVKAVAETGVDYISIGALTHSVKAMDISLNLTLNK